jgi:hypothetical protein
MSIILNDNIDVRAPKPADARFGTSISGTTGFYATTSDANAAIPTYQRYIGLTVGIKVGNNPIQEYWYANGINNADLVIKSGTVSGAGSGLNLSSGTINLGGTLSTPTTLATSATNTLSLTGLVTTTSPLTFLTIDSNGVITASGYSSVATNVLTNLTVDNGLTKTGNNIKLGGTLTAQTIVTLGNNQLLFSGGDSAISGYGSFTKSAAILETGDRFSADPNGSFTRIISFKSSAALWLTNYNSPAYNAQSNWIAAHPWVTFTPIHNFQVVDEIHAVSRESTIIAHYFDERVGNPNWEDSWYSDVDPGFPGWIPGNVYTLRTLEGSDVFQLGMASSTIDGIPGSAGWVFVSNGTTPTIWNDLSRVDGDYPSIEFAQNSSRVICDEDSLGNGRVKIDAVDAIFTSSIDQRLATRGIMPARWDNAGRPLSPNSGEMGYNSQANKMEYYNGTAWIQF